MTLPLVARDDGSPTVGTVGQPSGAGCRAVLHPAALDGGSDGTSVPTVGFAIFLVS